MAYGNATDRANDAKNNDGGSTNSGYRDVKAELDSQAQAISAALDKNNQSKLDYMDGATNIAAGTPSTSGAQGNKNPSSIPSLSQVAVNPAAPQVDQNWEDQRIYGIRAQQAADNATQNALNRFGAAGFRDPTSGTSMDAKEVIGATHAKFGGTSMDAAASGGSAADYSWMLADQYQNPAINVAADAKYDVTKGDTSFFSNFNPTQITGNTATGVQGSGLSQEAIAAMNANKAGAIGNDLAAYLAQQAQGKGVSGAQAQLQAATDANLKAQQAAAAANRGQFNPALLRAISAKAAETQQTAANQSAQLKAQEAAQAAQTGASLTANLSGQNIQGSQGEQALATSTAAADADRQQKQDMANQEADTQYGLTKLGIQGNLERDYGNNATIAAQFLAGKKVDASMLTAQQKQQLVSQKLAVEATGRENARARIWDKNKSDAENEMEITKWNQAEDNKVAITNASFINDLKAKKGDAIAKLNELAANFIASQEQQQFNQEQRMQNFLLELDKMQNNIALAKIGSPIKPSNLERTATVIGSLTGSLAGAAKMMG